MINDNLTITEEKTGEKSIRLIAKGQITADTAGKLKKKLEDAVSNKKNYIVINMSRVTFLSSGGIRIILSFSKILKSNGGEFYIQSPSVNVRNVIGMIALNEMLYK
ncbi:MAG: STAS domain-containing protein [Treponema sp.]|jgi:anti-anti-sigma factor|nr:STAS domain-containing protein [Treponema sp.]